MCRFCATNAATLQNRLTPEPCHHITKMLFQSIRFIAIVNIMHMPSLLVINRKHGNLNFYLKQTTGWFPPSPLGD